MQAFPSLDELLLNPVIAAAVVVAGVNVISYALGVKPNWLAVRCRWPTWWVATS